MKDAPQGPTTALLNVRIVIIVVFDALANRQSLSKMQLIGLLFGTLGTMILSVPKQMKELGI